MYQVYGISPAFPVKDYRDSCSIFCACGGKLAWMLLLRDNCISRR